MTIIETRTTVSFMYYVKKRKDDLVRRVEELESLVKLEPRTSYQLLRSWTRNQLARHAMALHGKLPE